MCPAVVGAGGPPCRSIRNPGAHRALRADEVASQALQSIVTQGCPWSREAKREIERSAPCASGRPRQALKEDTGVKASDPGPECVGRAVRTPSACTGQGNASSRLLEEGGLDVTDGVTLTARGPGEGSCR